MVKVDIIEMGREAIWLDGNILPLDCSLSEYQRLRGSNNLPRAELATIAGSDRLDLFKEFVESSWSSIWDAFSDVWCAGYSPRTEVLMGGPSPSCPIAQDVCPRSFGKVSPLEEEVLSESGNNDYAVLLFNFPLLRHPSRRAAVQKCVDELPLRPKTLEQYGNHEAFLRECMALLRHFCHIYADPHEAVVTSARQVGIWPLKVERDLEHVYPFSLRSPYGIARADVNGSSCNRMSERCYSLSD